VKSSGKMRHFFLSFYSPVVTFCTVRFNTQKFHVSSADTVCLCVLCGPENKQRLFPVVRNRPSTSIQDLLHPNSWQKTSGCCYSS